MILIPGVKKVLQNIKRATFEAVGSMAERATRATPSSRHTVNRKEKTIVFASMEDVETMLNCRQHLISALGPTLGFNSLPIQHYTD